MKTGRKTKYKPIFVEKVDEYIEKTKETGKELPTREGFALFIGVVDNTLDNWEGSKDEEGNLLYPGFLRALRKLEMTQKTQLVNDGLYNGANSTIAKLLLMNNHGMKERNDQTTNDKDLPAPILGGVSKGEL